MEKQQFETTALADQEAAEPARPPQRSLFYRVITTMGPGLMVCFADTDGPCLITAAQSGAEFNYALLSLQLILIPVLYAAQELTVRLGLLRGKGVVGLLKDDLGPVAAWLVAAPLLFSCAFGLVSEFIVIGQTMLFWGWSIYLTNALVAFTLLALAFSGSYNVAEKVGLSFGAMQVLLLITMFSADPKFSEMADGFVTFPFGNQDFIKLITANIGAVIMPWMLAYQQSAICEKFGRDSVEDSREHLVIERWDTAIGSLLTQAVMAAMLVTVAATTKTGADITSVDDLLTIFTTVLGNETSAKWFLTFAIIGACMVAAIVQTMAAAWCVEEALGQSLESSASFSRAEARSVAGTAQKRPVFYLCYVLVCVGGFTISVLADSEITTFLSVLTEFLNGVLMPPVVFALWYLAAYKLPEGDRLGEGYKWFLFVVFFICSAFCLGSIAFSFGGDDAAAPANSTATTLAATASSTLSIAISS